MAATVRSAGWGGASNNQSELLVSYINDEIKVLEPQLQFARLGKKRDAAKGYDRILFPQTNQLPVKINMGMTYNTGANSVLSGSVWGAGSSINGTAVGSTAGGAGYGAVSADVGVAAITEGTNPTAVTWGATAYSTGPNQFGILVQVSDLLVHNSAIEVVDSASMQVRNALARLVDTAIQNVVNAGTFGRIYAGGKTTRATVAAGDLCTQNEMGRAYKMLASANAAGLRPFEGKYYVAVIHPMVEADLMANTGSGSWTDVGRYTSVDELLAGAMGDFRGIRYLRSAWVNYWNSTVPVFPTTVMGDESFGWGFFQPPTPIVVSTPDSYNPLNLFTSIGGKVTLGVTRFEDSAATQRIECVESAISN
jgi:N4-gp56 family major capsid protein